MKYCEDCKWFKTKTFLWVENKSEGLCLSEDIELIYDEAVSRDSAPYAAKERSLSGSCGVEGQFWEAK